MPRVLLVQTTSCEFRLTIPDNAKITFGPFSPPTKEGRGGYREENAGTLRIYQDTKDNIIFCQSGVTGFRDVSLEYSRKVTTEEVSTVWQSDDGTYKREVNGKRTEAWVPEQGLTQLPPPPARGGRKR